MKEKQFVHRNLLGTLEVPDWEAYAQELEAKAATCESSRELLACIYEIFPEARVSAGGKSESGQNAVQKPVKPRPRKVRQVSRMKTPVHVA